MAQNSQEGGQVKVCLELTGRGFVFGILIVIIATKFQNSSSQSVPALGLAIWLELSRVEV
jgi:hypothetical protein